LAAITTGSTKRTQIGSHKGYYFKIRLQSFVTDTSMTLWHLPVVSERAVLDFLHLAASARLKPV
jgi:hypothetical protein